MNIVLFLLQGCEANIKKYSFLYIIKSDSVLLVKQDCETKIVKYGFLYIIISLIQYFVLLEGCETNIVNYCFLYRIIKPDTVMFYYKVVKLIL